MFLSNSTWFDIYSFDLSLFLAHLSKRLKWAFLITICPLSILIVVVVVVNIFISFSRTTVPISTKLGIKHPFVKGIQVYSNEGPCPFPRRDNYQIVKYIDEILKSSYPEPLGQFQPNLAQSILGWRGFKFVQMKNWRTIWFSKSR